ncbi:MAG: hypothetical protein JNL21_28435 [Myxococcales bacterium]|nr:hypothetical protein [Myxococcales bacterium]
MEPSRIEPAADAFQRAFAAVSPLILEEWPGLDDKALAETEGDFDRVVALVADHTDRTRVVVRRKLGELLVVAEKAEPQRRENGAAAPAEARKPALEQMDEIIATVRRLEAFAADEAKRVSAKIIPAAESRVHKSPWMSLLFALGLGLIFGLWLNGGRRQR